VIDGIEELEDEGVFECFFSTRFVFLAFVTSVKGRPLSITFLGKDRPPLIEREFKTAMVDRSQLLNLLASEEEVLDKFYKQQPSYETLEKITTDMAEELNHTFSEVALQIVEADRRTDCIMAMMERGFWNILDQKLDNLKAFAHLGVVASLPLSEDERKAIINNGELRLSMIEMALEKFGFSKNQIDTTSLFSFI
jgi:hypothetical protein